MLTWRRRLAIACSLGAFAVVGVCLLVGLGSASAQDIPADLLKKLQGLNGDATSEPVPPENKPDLETYKPVIVVGMDDETNLSHLFTHYRLKLTYSFKQGEAPPPPMIRPLGAFFSSDPLVIKNAQRLLLVAAVFQVLDAINIVLRGSLRGAKDVRAVAIIGILIVWSFLPTSAYLLGKHCGLGALGGWLGFVGETLFASFFFWRRWKKGGWRAIYTK